MYNVVITRAKNEHGYLNVFINHYLNLGFDLIYIFIEKDQKYEKTYPKTLFIKHDYKGDNVVPFMFKKVKIKKKKINWVLHVDIDEFLFLKDNIKIYDYLKKFNKKSIGQFIFKWAMLENFRSINTENDFQNILNQSKLYFNNHYKSIVKLAYIKCSDGPHQVKSKKDTYLDNIKIENEKLKGYCDENNNYSNAILIHYHTRNLENLFVKALVTNLSEKKINPNILNKNLSIIELKIKMKKLSLPFGHAKKKVLNKKNIFKFKFNINTKIDKKIINNILEDICKLYNVKYNIIIKYIKDLEFKYSNHFLN
jgi:hypothetical protein